MSFDHLQRVADAILYEGYVLYPYRASAAKNRVRWQFGVIAPRGPGETDGEPWFSQTECLVEPAGDASLAVRVRCLRPAAPGANGWLDGVPQSVDIEPVALSRLPSAKTCVLDLEGVSVRFTARAEPADRFVRVRLRLENMEPWRDEFTARRDGMLCRSLVSAHLLLEVQGGEFVSLLDPPAAAATIVAALDNRHTWPVLVGDRTRRSFMLSSPIVLYDYPAIASESPGDLCDATEIDEILSLRIATLTEDEKREARATDPRARQIIDRVDSFSPDDWQRLHGTLRSADFFNPPGEPAPEDAFVDVRGTRIMRGSRVWLRPSRRADAMDLFLRDQAATVAGVYRDVDDRVYVAVTVDADPAAPLHESFGRFFYFDPGEVEPRAEAS